MRKTTLQKLIARQGLPRVAQRLHRSAIDVNRWVKRGKVPAKYQDEILVAWKRSERAKKAAKVQRSPERKEIRRLRAELESERKAHKKLKRKKRALDYFGQLDEIRNRAILTPTRTLRKIAERFRMPLRTVYSDYFSPSFSGEQAA